MSSTQVTTWRRYTAAEKKAYHQRRFWRGEGVRQVLVDQHVRELIRERRHHFADNYGSRVPTARVNGEVL